MLAHEFLKCIDDKEIPPYPPNGCIGSGLYTTTSFWKHRVYCTERGMWAIVTKDLATALANWIQNRRVLEVMAGRGWLAKALDEQGVDIIATDNNSWDDRHSKLLVSIFPVERLDAVIAVEKYSDKSDVLLVSWPPYGDEAICDVARAWGITRPIIYFGEGWGGCNAPDEFFEHFVEEDTDIRLASWPGIHDNVCIGHWSVK